MPLQMNSFDQAKAKQSFIVSEDFLENRLKAIIEDWQTRFFKDYIQPTMQNQYDQMEHKILLSIDKKSNSELYTAKIP